jgi:hypothetical protein
MVDGLGEVKSGCEVKLARAEAWVQFEACRHLDLGRIGTMSKGLDGEFAGMPVLKQGLLKRTYGNRRFVLIIFPLGTVMDSAASRGV